MKLFYYLFSLLILVSCKEKQANVTNSSNESLHIVENVSADLTVVFASCNDQDRPQPLWIPVIQNNPDVFIWGGDNVYADTDDMAKMKSDYDKVLANPEYAKLLKEVELLGTWDDHDYGMNDGGKEWDSKEDAKELALNFFGTSENDVRRQREGLYYAETIENQNGSVKFILLDTRTFRDGLLKSADPAKRYDPWPEGEGGTLLGDTQWKWLENELKDDSAEFTVIVSSIQFLAYDHGWEKWANFPGEVTKLYNLIQQAKAKNIMIFSGDRHMAEISVNSDAGLPYPLVDFTSSGMTHTWIDGATEGNEYRVSNVVKRLNFGVILFDFERSEVRFQIRGENNFLYEEFLQKY